MMVTGVKKRLRWRRPCARNPFLYVGGGTQQPEFETKRGRSSWYSINARLQSFPFPDLAQTKRRDMGSIGVFNVLNWSNDARWPRQGRISARVKRREELQHWLFQYDQRRERNDQGRETALHTWIASMFRELVEGFLVGFLHRYRGFASYTHNTPPPPTHT
jgi:hypothetical protein